MTRAVQLATVVLGAAVVSVAFGAAQDPFGEEEQAITIEVRDGYRHIKARGLPNHATGVFTYRDRAIELREQGYEFRVPEKPQETRRPTEVNRGPFGIAINGVVFDPRGEEEHDNDDWTYEPLRNERLLEIDAHSGHADRRGTYHYHGLPVALIATLGKVEDMRLIGWAADGFPIYDRYGYRDPMDPSSGLKVLQPSYWTKPGNRPTTPYGPHDGTFTEDWAYVEGRGDLDECNGRIGVTPEFPDGTYYYVITERFPGVPRYFRGTPDPTFTRRRREEW